ncbi:hypothetical protein J6TS1_25060 [Siminovitchia terrae]|uniref:DUF4097 domain-containing protein n=1 Tax=Siminovitchia terrae TaxID=1914933 RepID=A0ABQ4KXF6_SIMTE|nr:DUF4097 family beta strand repeat-containing protein [Siminovitchia terrae]GIN92329.1 hypothetical protein J22TS1_33800 [Siminovitchia terrae]GIN96636.1 hypothetical protein J6TS1_25060 [Siminovitchia terrae]
MIKKVSIIALVLLIVGIAGSLLTVKSKMTGTEVSETKTVQGNFSNIDVNTNSSRIEILPTKDSTATAELSGEVGKGEKFTFDADVKHDTLLVRLKNKQKFIHFDFYPTSPLSLKVYLPEKEYDSMQIKNNNGRVHVERMETEELIVDIDNGRIELSDIKGSSVRAKSANGRIDAKNIRGASFTTRLYNGRINLEDVEGEISGQTSNGRISLITDNLDRPIDLGTDNGRIEILATKEPENATFDIRVGNGKVNVFGEPNRKEAVFGNGENLIKLSTSNGSVTVSK